MPIFLDFEASSWFADSFPVEVAWCSHDLLRGWSAIIRPCPEWQEWSPKAEEVHGLSRAVLEQHGMPADEVMARLSADLGDSACVSDNPEFDARWLERLAHGAGAQPSFSVDETPFDAVLAAAEQQAGNPGVHPMAAQVLARHAGLQGHRALDDAVANALRLGAVAAAAAERDHGAAAAAAMRQELIGRAKKLLADHGRRQT